MVCQFIVFLFFQILDYLGKSSDADSSSPDEFLLSRSRWRMPASIWCSRCLMYYMVLWHVLLHGSRKTLIYLVLTLNHVYPDYDFRYLLKFLCTTSCMPKPFFVTNLDGGLWVMLLSAYWAAWQPTLYSYLCKNWIGSVVKRIDRQFQWTVALVAESSSLSISRSLILSS